MAPTHLIVSEKLSQFSEVRYAMSTREGGVGEPPFGMNLSYHVGDEEANVIQNRKIFFESIGLDLTRAAFPLQCHSSKVKVAAEPGLYEECDALVTSMPDLPLVVTVADCLPIVLYDYRRTALGLVHAGWKGTAERITENAIRLMIQEFQTSTSHLIVYLGPSAGVCCYEVGPEVARQFPERVVERRAGKLYLDLKQANLQQLLSWGVRREQIEISSYCTICHPELFHSYRRDREQSGRMMAVASLISQTSE
ncbi:MAG: peptidoglycan editing factor PgeF [Ignavibacteria bacterium]|nr:peptidoglycan editing factor PgeF [Ignavibacteria bacterium]